MTGDHSPAAGAGAAMLALHGVGKSFGAVTALHDVHFRVDRGQVVCLVGDNGAGKSTLMKVVAGMHAPTTGEVLVGGEHVRIANPMHARRLGIETVHQGLALVDLLDVTQNFFLGRELSSTPLRLVRNRRMRQIAAAAVADLGVTIPGGVDRQVASLSGGQRQAIAIARAAHWHTRLLLLDEPTAALGVQESEHVVQLVDQLAHARGAAVLLVTHNMEQVRRLADKVVVVRQGRVVAVKHAPFAIEEVVGYITGARSPEPGAGIADVGAAPSGMVP